MIKNEVQPLMTLYLSSPILCNSVLYLFIHVTVDLRVYGIPMQRICLCFE